MSWIFLSIWSAVFLGLYDIAKKSAARENAVPPVLLLNVLTSSLIWLPLTLLSRFHPEGLQRFAGSLFYVDSLSWSQHALLLTKAVIAGSSWIFALFGMKHLPLSIAAPIRASSPVWTVLIATVFMNERPSSGQWLGIAIITASFYAFSLVGSREGIHFHRNRWVACMLIATVLGSVSALYDKYLLQNAELTAASVQAWFSFYLILVMLPPFLYWLRSGSSRAIFVWRWSIPMISVFLLISDYLYFSALRQPSALISLVSPARRTSIMIPFLAGAWFLGEKNWRPKAVCLAALLGGVYVLSIAGSR
jgi:transporter family protein